MTMLYLGGNQVFLCHPKKVKDTSRPQTSPLCHMLILVHYHIKGDDKGLAEGPLQAQPSKLGEPDFLCFTYLITTVLRWSVPTSIQKYQTTMWKTW